VLDLDARPALVVSVAGNPLPSSSSSPCGDMSDLGAFELPATATTPRTEFATKAGLDEEGVRRFGECMLPKFAGKLSTPDFEKLGFSILEKHQLRAAARVLFPPSEQVAPSQQAFMPETLATAMPENDADIPDADDEEAAKEEAVLEENLIKDLQVFSEESRLNMNRDESSDENASDDVMRSGEEENVNDSAVCEAEEVSVASNASVVDDDDEGNTDDEDDEDYAMFIEEDDDDDDDDRDDYVHPNDWLMEGETALECWILNPPDKLAGIKLHENHLTALAYHSRLRDDFISALQTQDIPYAYFHLQYLEELVAEFPFVTADRVLACGVQIGEAFRKLGTVNDLIFTGCNIFNMPFVNAIVERCCNVKSLTIKFFMYARPQANADLYDLLSLHDALQTNANLEHVYCYFPKIETFRTIVHALSTAPKLESFVMKGVTEAPLMLDARDADALAKVLMFPSLRTVILSTMHFVTVDVAYKLCRAVRRSNFTDLQLHDVQLPPDTEDDLAAAIAMSCVVNLNLPSYQSETDRRLLQAILCWLPRWHGIQSLIVGSRLDCNDTDHLVPSFQNSHQWQLRELTLSVRNWTNAFDQALSAYIRGNGYLRKLTFAVSEEFDSNVTASDRLIAAANSGARCLEEVVFQREEKDNGLTTSWCKNLAPILNLNRQRNQMRPLLEAASLASSKFVCRLRLIEAVEVLELEGLFAFLPCDELELLTLLQLHGRQCVGDVQRSSRKRPADALLESSGL
jgi:hypothetical protein